MKGKIIGIVGPSGVGKTTIISFLVWQKSRLEKIFYLTSRPKRWYEVNKRDYLFVTREEINIFTSSNLIPSDLIVKVKEDWFVLDYPEIERKIENGGVGLIELYIDKVPELKEKYGNNFSSIFLIPPSINILWQRLKRYRLHDETFISERMIQAKKEIKFATGTMEKSFDAFVTLSPNLKMAIGQAGNTIAIIAGRVCGT